MSKRILIPVVVLALIAGALIGYVRGLPGTPANDATASSSDIQLVAGD